MLVAVFGDTHGNLDAMYERAQAWEERTGLTLDLLVQIGDFGFWLDEENVDATTKRHGEEAKEKHGTPICGDFPDYVLGNKRAYKQTLIIRGNHEDQEFLMNHERRLMKEYPEDYLTRTVEVAPNMFYLPDGHVVDWEGVKFGGLGGNFSVKTWEKWNYWDEARNKRLRYGEKRRLNHFTRDRWEALARQKIDVLLFHDAPTGMELQGASGGQLPDDEMTEKVYNQFGCPFLRELVEIVQPHYTFCGHWHQYRRKKIGESTCIVLNKTDRYPEPDCMEVVEL